MANTQLLSNKIESTIDRIDDQIAIAHKDYDVRGGGEILAETLADGLNAPLIVGHGNVDNQPDEFGRDVIELNPESRWHKLADRDGVPRAIGHWMLWRDYADGVLSDFDTIVTSGNEPLWWTAREEQTWIAYTHSTPRWLYDLNYKLDGWTVRTINQLKKWLYEQDINGPDLWIANSDVVRRRMERYWQIDSEDIWKVYPPVKTRELHPEIAATDNYYLSLGRLDDTKRVEQSVEAANDLGVRLKVAGTGPNEDELHKLAGPTVEFLGWVSGEEKRELLSGAKGLLSSCMNEDFGMVIVEAIASGTPVLTVSEGMPQYLVKDGVTGLVFEVGNMVEAIQQFEEMEMVWSEEKMHEWADSYFSEARFIREIQQAIEMARDRTKIEPTFDYE